MAEKYSNIQLEHIANSLPNEQKNTKWSEIRRERLINSLNRINFQDEEIILKFKHQKYNTYLSLPAKPQPCTDNIFHCQLSDSEVSENELKSYFFEYFYYTDGLKKILVEAELSKISSENIKFILPKTCVEISSRKIKRHKCRDVVAQLTQDGLILEGALVSFSAVSFAVHVSKYYRENLQCFNKNSTVHLILKKNATFFYSGLCEVARLSSPSDGSVIILKPTKSQIQRFKSKKYRSLRHKLSPMPNIIFDHPLIPKIINIKALDISGSGFSVEENLENSTLIPGMIIQNLSLELMNNVELSCKAQVVYRSADEVGKIRCGFAFLDMSLKDQVSLSSLLHQAWNKKAHVCTKVDVDDLWDFFFDTDFIYPEKYSFIYKNKQEFKDIYRKLYEKNPDFAINFICKDMGQILAHMSMYRFYSKTWIINHHAAKSRKNNRGGLVVLEQISRYINEFHQFNASVMDYVACYFRPENKFPNLVFGGVAKSATDLTSCSIDQFAYLLTSKKYLDGSLTNKWSLSETRLSDLKTLKHYYEEISGGLTLQALDLTPDRLGKEDELNSIYSSFGFKRGKLLFSLKKNNQLIAIFMVSISNIGLSLSDLTNCIHVFVLESNKLPNSTLHAALSEIVTCYEHDNIPLLIFPSSYTDNNSISINKMYNFWVLDVHRIGDRYFSYLDKLLRLSK